tara:strand:- start:435 stop:998 length:564 start_codon:yes stop_codon:yes gene_type:complete
MTKKEILKKNLKSLTESKTQQLRSINNISRQIMNLKTELVTDPSNPLKNNDLKYLTDTVGKLLKTFDGIDDERIEDEAVEDDENVVTANEGSEGHGKMPEEAGLRVENVIKLSEKTLKNVIKRVIQEQKNVSFDDMLSKLSEAVTRIKKVSTTAWKKSEPALTDKELADGKKKAVTELKSILDSYTK